MKDPEEIFVVVYQTDQLSHPDGHYFTEYDKALKQARREIGFWGEDNNMVTHVEPIYATYPDGRGGDIKQLWGYRAEKQNGEIMCEGKVYSLVKSHVGD